MTPLAIVRERAVREAPVILPPHPDDAVTIRTAYCEDILRLEHQIAELQGDRDTYRTMVQTALTQCHQLIVIVRTQRRCLNQWTREHAVTLPEELLWIDDWLDRQLTPADPRGHRG